MKSNVIEEYTDKDGYTYKLIRLSSSHKSKKAIIAFDKKRSGKEKCNITHCVLTPSIDPLHLIPTYPVGYKYNDNEVMEQWKKIKEDCNYANTSGKNKED